MYSSIVVTALRQRARYRASALPLLLVLSLVCTLAPAIAQESQPASPAPPSESISKPPAVSETRPAEPAAATSPAAVNHAAESSSIEPPKPAMPPAAKRSPESAAGGQTITVRKGDKVITITGVRPDQEFDSVGDFVKSEPEVAGTILMIVAFVFLSPVIAIALILAYRMRKARMLNETMLKLAEKGIVPPAEALQAVARGSAVPAPSVADMAPSTGPLHEQANRVRERAASSDLRKGVIIGAVGLGLTAYSALSYRPSPNVAGLILLFLGVGYVVIWWFEQRHLPGPNDRFGDGDRGAGKL